MSIVGVLPAAGSGSRLGLPFPKPLAPTFTQQGIQPLYAHAYDRLRRVADRIVFVLSPEADPCLASLPGERIVKPERGELPSSLALVARSLRPDDLVAVALPDAMFWPVEGMRLLLWAYRGHQPLDGVLGTFDASSHLLDAVTVSQNGYVSAIVPHADPPTPPRYVRGWGCLVASAGCLAGLTDDRPLAPQLAEYHLRTVHLGPHYYDLGTPKRYRDNIDRPMQMDEQL